MVIKFILAIISMIFTSYIMLPEYAGKAEALEDRLIAIVNNEIITQKDLNDFVNFMRIELSTRHSEEEVQQRINQMLPDLIDRLIEDRLILQAAYEQNIIIDPDQIKAKVEQVREKYRNDAAFLNALAGQGLTLADIELKIKEQLLMAEIIEKEVRSKIVVKPKEITDYYHEYGLDLKTPEQRQVRLATIKDAKLARRLQRLISRYEDLDNLAADYSLEVMDLGWVRVEQLKPEIANEIFALEKGSLWLFLETSGDSYIFEVREIKLPEKMSLSQAQEQISNFLFQRKMQQAMTQWLDKLRSEAYVEIKYEAN